MKKAVQRMTGDDCEGLLATLRFRGRYRGIQLRGRVVGKAAPGLYLVECHESRGTYTQRLMLVRVQDMIGWQFYDDEDEWRASGYVGA